MMLGCWAGPVVWLDGAALSQRLWNAFRSSCMYNSGNSLSAVHSHSHSARAHYCFVAPCSRPTNVVKQVQDFVLESQLYHYMRHFVTSTRIPAVETPSIHQL